MHDVPIKKRGCFKCEETDDELDELEVSRIAHAFKYTGLQDQKQIEEGAPLDRQYR